MATFRDANQVRLHLKMKLSAYSWYDHSAVIMLPNGDGYSVIIYTKIINNEVRKVIPPVINDVEIKTELG